MNMLMFVTMTPPGIWQIALIVLLLILLFGGKKIPEMMRGMGRGVKEFKDAVNKDYTEENKEKGESENRKIEENK